MDKPLVIVTAYNRRELTMRTLAALEETTEPGSIDLVVVNDASEDDTHAHLVEWDWAGWPARVYHLLQNIGCPRALNYAMVRHREAGQPMVKLDNDVEILTPGWVGLLADFLSAAWGIFGPVGMVMAHYDGCTRNRLAHPEPIEVLGYPTWVMEHTIGHCVWHTGDLLDQVGYFDVLADDHRYGFEDLLMSVKSRLLGMTMLVWEGWQIRNIQRSSSLGAANRDAHVAEMRPLYEARRQALEEGRLDIFTTAHGQPWGVSY